MKSIPSTTSRILACTWAVPGQAAVGATLPSGVRATHLRAGVGAAVRPNATLAFEVEPLAIEK